MNNVARYVTDKLLPKLNINHKKFIYQLIKIMFISIYMY